MIIKPLSFSKIRANISDAFLDRLSKGKGRIIITASSAGEVSKESRARQKARLSEYFSLQQNKGRSILKSISKKERKSILLE